MSPSSPPVNAPLVEPASDLTALSYAVIGAAIEVHRILGPGFLESVYEEALALELTARGIPFRRQAPVQVLYKGVPVGEGRLDLLVGGALIVELKAADALLPIHRAQLISYLKTTGLTLGLLLNFKVLALREGIERIVHTP